MRRLKTSRSPWRPPRHRPSPHRSDAGAATVWAVWSAMSLCAVFGVVLALGQAVAVRHQTAGAADLAALAAAGQAQHGRVVACRAAQRVASAQDAWVVRCALGAGGVADLTAQMRWGPYAPSIRARAGPPAAAR